MNLKTNIPIRAEAPTTRISLEKSPLRRNDIIRKVTKKMAAVPKSPIIANEQRQNAEKAINIVKFFFCCSSFSVAAPIYMNTIFTSSDGWKEKPPIFIQFCDPYFIVPKARFASNKTTLKVINKYAIFFVRSRSLKNQHRTKNKPRPKPIVIVCFNIVVG